MSAVTATMIKELRERTGIGMGKCKEALEEAHGDMELAIANLRKSGMLSAAKKEGRETKEGMIGAASNNQRIALVEISAETDFVVKNDRFKQFLETIAAEIAATNPNSLESFMNQRYSQDSELTIDQYRATVVQAIGENIQIKRLLVVPKTANHSYGVYSHLGGKIVVIIDIEGSDKEEELAKNIALHTAAAAPEYLAPEKVPAHILEQEKEIARAQVKDKPAQIIDKIVEGKIKSFNEMNCLLFQKYIKDDKLTIKEVVDQQGKASGRPLTIVNFWRWTTGR